MHFFWQSRERCVAGSKYKLPYLYWIEFMSQNYTTHVIIDDLSALMMIISSFITKIKLFLISGDATRHVDYNYLGSQDVPQKDHFNISFLKLFWKCHRECDFGSVCTRSFTKNEDIIHLYWLLLYLMDDGHTDCMTKALYVHTSYI